MTVTTTVPLIMATQGHIDTQALSETGAEGVIIIGLVGVVLILLMLIWLAILPWIEKRRNR